MCLWPENRDIHTTALVRISTANVVVREASTEAMPLPIGRFRVNVSRTAAVESRQAEARTLSGIADTVPGGIVCPLMMASMIRG
jgi:hypothetical protein